MIEINNIIYSVILISIILFSLNLILVSYSAPKKIKLLGIWVALLMLMRSTSLMILCFSSTLINLYLYKPFCYTYIIYIPLEALLSLFIFLRSDKFKINSVMIISFLFIPIYLFLMIKVKSNLLTAAYGYIIKLNIEYYIEIMYIFIYIFIVLCTIKFLNNGSSIFYGIIIILVSSIISIIEIILMQIGIGVFPQIVIGDLMWCIILNISIGTLKKG